MALEWETNVTGILASLGEFSVVTLTDTVGSRHVLISSCAYQFRTCQTYTASGLKFMFAFRVLSDSRHFGEGTFASYIRPLTTLL